MGSDRAARLGVVLACCALSVAAAWAQVPGWHYSPLHGEGDRASLGCATGASPTRFQCLAVRCEDDFSVGIYVYTSDPWSNGGAWELSVDDQTFLAEAQSSIAPYSQRLVDAPDELLDHLRHGSVVYLRPDGAEDAPAFRVDLSGSMQAIDEALYYCAPRNGPSEQNPAPGVESGQAKMGENK